MMELARLAVRAALAAVAAEDRQVGLGTLQLLLHHKAMLEETALPFPVTVLAAEAAQVRMVLMGPVIVAAMAVTAAYRQYPAHQ
jgi:hypothetical protein